MLSSGRRAALAVRIPLGCRGAKFELPVKWVMPERVPGVSTVRSGDCEPAPDLPPNTVLHRFRRFDVIAGDNDRLKFLCSIEYYGKEAYRKYITTELVNRIKRHEYDNNSMETRIAKLTGEIRYLQLHLQFHPRDGNAIKTCSELIDKRKSWLRSIRKTDYKKFEWLLETLDLIYKPSPNDMCRLSIKSSTTKLVMLYIKETRERKLEEFRKELEKKKKEMLKMFAENPLPLPNYEHNFDVIDIIELNP